MEEVINGFSAGVDRDTALHLVRPDRLVALKDLRLIENSGQGFILTSFGGNDQTFQLSTGFLPLGCAEYGGVAFIVSYNPFTGEGEVGTYPSPQANCSGGFVHAYAPLQNWNGSTNPQDGTDRQPFRTTLWGFDCTRQIEIVPRIDYDNSVKLFLTDWRNPLRYVNTGFDINSGVCNNRLYWTGNFVQGTDVFFESCTRPQVAGITLEGGGALQFGNYVFYGRYLTADLNATSFLIDIGPVQVSAEELTDGVIIQGGPPLGNSGRSVTIDLLGIDPSYTYVELGFTYFNGDTFVTGLIDQRYVIPSDSTTLSIHVSGTETVVDLALATLLRRKNDINCVRSITDVDNIIWGGNWKESDKQYADLEQVSGAVKALPATTGTLPDGHARQQVSTPLQYQDYRKTWLATGYHRCEPYTFGVVFVFKNGQESLPYPVQGYDAWFDPGATTPNAKGILRMPDNTQAPYYTAVGNTAVQLLGVSFDTTSAPLTDWMQANVCGFYVVRGERRPTILYQGVVGNCFQADSQAYLPFPWCDGPPDTGNLATTFIPELIDAVSAPFARGPRRTDDGGNGEVDTVGFVPVENRFGLFSSDHFFERTLVNGLYTVVVQGRMAHTGTRMSAGYPSDSQRDPDLLFETTAFTPHGSYLAGKAFAYNVADNARQQTGPGFVAGYYEGNQDNFASGSPFLFFSIENCGLGQTQEVGNRTIRQRTYIGLSLTESGADPSLATPLTGLANDAAVVNIHSIDPDPGNGFDLSTWYDPASTTYHKISDFLPVSAWDTLGGSVFYKGDCFVQRTYHRHWASDGYHPNDFTQGGAFYKYGNMAGLTQECTVNTAMRYQVITTDPGPNMYYPRTAPVDPMHFAGEFGSWEESSLHNGGYEHILGVTGRLGNDALVPFRGVQYRTRIMYAHTYVSDTFVDGWLQWDLDAFRDFDQGPGEIVKLTNWSGRLYSIQEHAINLHPINERAVLSPTVSEGELLVGSGERLPEKAMVVSNEHGSQHQWSMVRTARAFYGYDQSRRSIWRLTGEGLDLLSDRKTFRADTVELSEIQFFESDVTRTYQDNPVCNAGVVAFHDRRNQEVGFSFYLEGGTTIVYSEKLDAYLHERGHLSPFYVNIHSDLFSVSPNSLGQIDQGPSFWLHDVNKDHGVYYDADPDQRLAVSVNAPQGGIKQFDSQHLLSSDQLFALAQWRTAHQQSQLVFDEDTPVWKEPRYMEDRWMYPVLQADSVFGQGVQEYGVGSRMRGPYLRSEWRWSTTDPLEVTTVNTILQRSFQ